MVKTTPEEFSNDSLEFTKDNTMSPKIRAKFQEDFKKALIKTDWFVLDYANQDMIDLDKAIIGNYDKDALQENYIEISINDPVKMTVKSVIIHGWTISY